jgi:Protein of unknown function (DUF2924)/Restriction Enzyme Adenine Methylase Associated
MYTSIDIDFDVYKELTVRRKTHEMTENDVLREMLGLNHAKSSKAQSNSAAQNSAGIPWTWKGVTFPHGTEFRAEYSGRKYYAKVEDGAIVYEGKRFKSPSPAARAVTGNSVNGWTFWECKMPGKNTWVSMSELRKD